MPYEKVYMYTLHLTFQNGLKIFQFLEEFLKDFSIR